MTGPCAKVVIECFIQGPGGRHSYGSNFCHNPQESCPRLPGEGYEKCHSICRQEGHAETVALTEYIERYGEDAVHGSTAEVYGHYHCCIDCAQALARAGVTEILIHVSRAMLPPVTK